MGRSIEYSPEKVDCPEPKTQQSVLEVISALKEGMIVEVVFVDNRNDALVRSPSNYGKQTSSYDEELVIDSINADDEFFQKRGIRVLLLRNIQIPQDEHQPVWVLTTDGYIRESEEYAILGYVSFVSRYF